MFYNNKIEKNIKYTEYKLENGLHVLLHKDKTNPIIALSVLYHVGSKNDPPGKKGFAHFFEHLMFEGTKNISKGDFFKYISSNGGVNNAYTTFDETIYYDILPSNNLCLAIWLESERMLHANVDVVGINIQRNVVKEEKKLSIDNAPYGVLFSEIIPSLLFKQHPYRFPIIGSIEDLNASKESDYWLFYKKHYSPNNAILSIAGDISIQETKVMINQYFSSIPNSNKKLSNIDLKIKKEVIAKEIFFSNNDITIKMPILVLAYLTPKRSDVNSIIFKIIEKILCNGESSVLIKKIINEQQLASYLNVFYQDLEDYGIFMIYAIPNVGISLDDIVEQIDYEIDKIKKLGISKHDLKKQINFLEKFQFMNNMFMFNLSNNLAKCHLYYKNANFINNNIDIYKKINIQDIKNMFNQYLTTNKRIRVYSYPSKN